MRVLCFLFHPVTLSFSYLLFLVSGESFGGPFLLYLVMALPHGVSFSVVGVAGLIGLMVVSSHGKERKKRIHVWLTLVSIILCWTSLYLFFASGKATYNSPTFQQAAPLISFSFFLLISFGAFTFHIAQLLRGHIGTTS